MNTLDQAEKDRCHAAAQRRVLSAGLDAWLMSGSGEDEPDACECGELTCDECYAAIGAQCDGCGHRVLKADLAPDPTNDGPVPFMVCQVCRAESLRLLEMERKAS